MSARAYDVKSINVNQQKSKLYIPTENKIKGVIDSCDPDIGLKQTTHNGTRLSDFQELAISDINAIPSKFRYTNFSETTASQGQIFITRIPYQFVRAREIDIK